MIHSCAIYQVYVLKKKKNKNQYLLAAVLTYKDFTGKYADFECANNMVPTLSVNDLGNNEGYGLYYRQVGFESTLNQLTLNCTLADE